MSATEKTIVFPPNKAKIGTDNGKSVTICD